MKIQLHTDARMLGHFQLAPMPLLLGLPGMEIDECDFRSFRFRRLCQDLNADFTFGGPAEADLWVLPFNFIEAERSAIVKDWALRFIDRSRRAGKPVIVFYTTDWSTTRFPSHVVLHKTVYQAELDSETAFTPLPGWSEDFISEYFGGALPLVERTATVGFRGYSLPLHSSLQLEARSFIISHLHRRGIHKGNLGNVLRRRAARALLRHPRIQTDFQINQYFCRDDGRSERKAFADHALRSAFNLCVRGNGNYSFRLYETLSLGRIPIMIDTGEAVPFKDVLRLDHRTVTVPADRIETLGDAVLRFVHAHTDASFKQLMADNRNVWLNHLSPEGYVRHCVRLWNQIISRTRSDPRTDDASFLATA